MDARATAVNWWNIEDNQDVVEVTIAKVINKIDDQGGGWWQWQHMRTRRTRMLLIQHLMQEEKRVLDHPPCPLLSSYEALDALEEVQ